MFKVTGTKGSERHKQCKVLIDTFLCNRLRGITPKKTKVIKFAFCVVYGDLFLRKCHVCMVSNRPVTEPTLTGIKCTGPPSVCRSQWLGGQRCWSAIARLLRLWVRIPPGGHGCLCVVSVVCCQVEVSATG